MDPAQMTPEQLEAARKAATIKRRLGFAFFFALIMGIFIPMIIGSFGGVARGEIYDPYTGELLAEGAHSTDQCLVDAEDLIVRSGKLQKLDPVWDDQTTDWVRRCRKDHPDIYLMLQDSRRKLRERKKAK